MIGFLETLESRQLLSGGIDASFGAPGGGGAPFSAGENSIVLDSAVDPAGRVVLAGRTTTTVDGVDTPMMFVARLHTNGAPDPKFGVSGSGGVIISTPRGVSEADFIVAVPSGGYIVVGRISDNFGGGGRVIKLKPNGFVDTRFAKNGAISLYPLSPTQVLVQPDGKVVIVGVAPADPDTTDAGSSNVMTRYNADGSLDTTFGENGTFVIGDNAESDQFFRRRATVTSASLDAAGNIVIVVSAKRTNEDAQEHEAGGTTSLVVQRFLGDGTRDAGFLGSTGLNHGAVLYSKTWSDPGQAQPVRTGVAVTRPDGQIAVLSDNEASSLTRAVHVDLLGPTGALPANFFDLSGSVSSFAADTSTDGALTAVADNTLLLAGTHTGATVNPAVVKLTATPAVDTPFGASGVLDLANLNGVNGAGDLAINPDGTVTAVSKKVANNAVYPDLRVTRLFVDDHPVVSLTRVRTVNNQLRVTVSIRGVNPIVSDNLDDNDLRLVDDLGVRTKLRLVNFLVDQSSEVVTATYRVNVGLLVGPGLHAITTFGVRAIHEQILDDHNNRNVSREIGTIVV